MVLGAMNLTRVSIVVSDSAAGGISRSIITTTLGASNWETTAGRAGTTTWDIHRCRSHLLTIHGVTGILQWHHLLCSERVGHGYEASH